MLLLLATFLGLLSLLECLLNCLTRFALLLARLDGHCEVLGAVFARFAYSAFGVFPVGSCAGSDFVPGRLLVL